MDLTGAAEASSVGRTTMEDESLTRCPSCGSDNPEAMGEYGSYILRCAPCGEPIVATSLIAIIADMGQDWLVEADLDHRRDKASDANAISKITGLQAAEILARRPLVRGSLAEEWNTVARIIESGIPLVLKFCEGTS
jgi:hypothetical protein